MEIAAAVGGRALVGVSGVGIGGALYKSGKSPEHVEAEARVLVTAMRRVLERASNSRTLPS